MPASSIPDWLLFSLVASVILTVALNLLPRLFPGMGRKLGQTAERRFLDRMEDHTTGSPRLRIVFPWKLMLIVSIGGTILLNLML